MVPTVATLQARIRDGSLAWVEEFFDGCADTGDRQDPFENLVLISLDKLS